MSTLFKVSILLASLVTSPFTLAEEIISDSSYFVGTWKLMTARAKLDIDTKINDAKLSDTPFGYLAGNRKKKFNEIWKFSQNGTFALTAEDHRASSTITTKTTFIVEDNMLKITKVGRPGKFFTYKVHQRDGEDMILKGGLEGYYFFKKQ